MFPIPEREGVARMGCAFPYLMDFGIISTSRVLRVAAYTSIVAFRPPTSNSTVSDLLPRLDVINSHIPHLGTDYLSTHLGTSGQYPGICSSYNMMLK